MNAFPLVSQNTVIFNISPHYPPDFCLPTKMLTHLAHQFLKERGISIFKYRQSQNFCITAQTVEAISEILDKSLLPVLLDDSSQEPPFEMDFEIECGAYNIDEIDVINIIAAFSTPLGILLKSDFHHGIHTLTFPNIDSYIIVILEFIQYLISQSQDF